MPLEQRAPDDARLVTTGAALRRGGISPDHIRAQLAARRWQRCGHAIVLHNGPLSERQRWMLARLHAGPGALLTAFTAAQAYGLTGWARDDVHVLGPAGTRLRRECPVPVVLHRTSRWDQVEVHRGGAVQALPGALLRAGATFASARPACGLLAAAVQQRLTSADRLRAALSGAHRTKHRAALLAAVADIERAPRR